MLVCGASGCVGLCGMAAVMRGLPHTFDLGVRRRAKVPLHGPDAFRDHIQPVKPPEPLPLRLSSVLLLLLLLLPRRRRRACRCVAAPGLGVSWRLSCCCFCACGRVWQAGDIEY
eukprot:COSAG05_NODE_74_length_21769_cov_194.316290_5_plen_114_part_00